MGKLFLDVIDEHFRQYRVNFTKSLFIGHRCNLRHFHLEPVVFIPQIFMVLAQVPKQFVRLFKLLLLVLDLPFYFAQLFFQHLLPFFCLPCVPLARCLYLFQFIDNLCFLRFKVGNHGSQALHPCIRLFDVVFQCFLC